MKELGAVGFPAPFHALFDSYTTPQAISSDRRPSKNRLLAIPQERAGYMRESEAHTRGRVARSHVILFSAQQFWGPRSSLLQNCLY